MTTALPQFEPNIAVFGVPEEPADSNDPRLVYDLSPEKAWRAWPCAECQTRLDEHADQDVMSRFPELDITDHAFVPALDDGASFFRARRMLPVAGATS